MQSVLDQLHFALHVSVATICLTKHRESARLIAYREKHGYFQTAVSNAKSDVTAVKTFLQLASKNTNL